MRGLREEMTPGLRVGGREEMSRRDVWGRACQGEARPVESSQPLGCIIENSK